MRRLTLTGKVQFDFQVRIGPYFADFVFPDRMLIIEVDGSTHARQAGYDAERDSFMKDLGFTVWRIKNKEVQSWPLIRLFNYQPPSQLALTYQQAIEFSVKCGFRPSEKRHRQGVLASDLDQPNFYPRLIKRVGTMKEPPLVYQRCSCGTKALVYNGQLGPHRRGGKGDQCPNA